MMVILEWVKKMKNKFLRILLSLLLIITPLSLSACSNKSTGVSGGGINGIVHEGIYESCIKGGSVSAAGKSITIDGTEIKMPIDWNYANTHQDNYEGNNWSGDDAARGIGIFNCNEEGDNSQEFADAYAVNMRWEYCSYGSQHGGYSHHVNYKGKDATGTYEVGGTDETCVSGGKIINQGPADAKQIEAYKKARILVYNPQTGKACVCGVGFNAYDTQGQFKGNCNWGGAPLALLGGITKKVSSTIGAEQNKSVLELYFVDPSTPLGECNFQGANISSGGSSSGSHNGCKDTSSVDASSAANLAVSAAFDKDKPDFPGHEMITDQVSGSNGSSKCPTTELAQKLRELATNGADNHSADCGYFVSSIVRLTLDKDYPTGYVPTQIEYCQNSDKWETVTSGSISSILKDKDKLQPGDVFSCSHHTFMYVGNEAIKQQFDYVGDTLDVVSASQDEYGPQLQSLSGFYAGSDSTYTVFRCKTTDPMKDSSGKEIVKQVSSN